MGAGLGVPGAVEEPEGGGGVCSPVDRELLQQHYLEGWSSNEIAPRLGISPVSVRVRLMRIKQGLRTALGLRGISMPEAA